MTNTESTTTPLTWTRRAAGDYTSNPDAEREGYRVYRSASDGGWCASTPVQSGTGRRDSLGVAGTMREAKERCQRHADTPNVSAWVDQLVTLLDSGAQVIAKSDNSVTVTGSGGWTLSPDRVARTIRVAADRGIVDLVSQRDGTMEVFLTERFRQERAAKRGIVVGAVVSYRSPLARRANPSRWEVAAIEGEYVLVASLDREDTLTAWRIERAELSDRHAYRPHDSHEGCSRKLRGVEDDTVICQRPADHPIHT